ncbi:hypothetical protein [Bordetella trematum]|uniref:hypothetical protein n=1 Tax=Bordetella trematum TaxID=123899 RepID=UPI003988E581
MSFDMSVDMSGVPRASPREAEFFLRNQHLTSSTIWRDYDLSEITERFRVKSPFGSKAGELELEARRFLWLSAKTKKELVPSELVDEYWHAMILNTATYR